MSEIKTSRHEADIDEFLNSVDDDVRRRDALVMKDLMSRLTGEHPRMWGRAIVGYGTYPYRPKSGGEREWFKVGFSPRKQALTLYLMDGFGDYDSLLEKLGKHTTGKACLYIKNLDDVDTDVLSELIERSVTHIEESTKN